LCNKTYHHVTGKTTKIKWPALDHMISGSWTLKLFVSPTFQPSCPFWETFTENLFPFSICIGFKTQYVWVLFQKALKCNSFIGIVLHVGVSPRRHNFIQIHHWNNLKNLPSSISLLLVVCPQNHNLKRNWYGNVEINRKINRS
jgi:hypothetical protein